MFKFGIIVEIVTNFEVFIFASMFYVEYSQINQTVLFDLKGFFIICLWYNVIIGLLANSGTNKGRFFSLSVDEH